MHTTFCLGHVCSLVFLLLRIPASIFVCNIWWDGHARIPFLSLFIQAFPSLLKGTCLLHLVMNCLRIMYVIVYVLKFLNMNTFPPFPLHVCIHHMLTIQRVHVHTPFVFLEHALIPFMWYAFLSTNAASPCVTYVFRMYASPFVLNFRFSCSNTPLAALCTCVHTPSTQGMYASSSYNFK